MQFSRYVENDIKEQDYTRVCVNGAFVCVCVGGGGGGVNVWRSYWWRSFMYSLSRVWILCMVYEFS